VQQICCIYTYDCPISVSIHFNINFSHISHRVFDFCHFICLFIFYNANILAPWLSLPSKAAVLPSSNVTHFSTCTPSYTLNLQEKPLESLDLKTIPWAGPLTISAPCVAHKKWLGKGEMSEWHKSKRKKVPCCLPNTINI